MQNDIDENENKEELHQFEDIIRISQGMKGILTRTLGRVGKEIGLTNGTPCTICGFWYDTDNNGMLTNRVKYILISVEELNEDE